MGISTEKKVGLFFLLTLIVLGFLIELVEDWNPFEDRVRYFADFASVVGLKAGDPVRVAGVEVGKIESIELAGEQVRVRFAVAKGTTVRADSVARIRQTNLLGGQFLGLDFGSEGSPILPPGSTVPTRESTNIDQLISNLDRNQERVFGELGRVVENIRGPLTDSVVRFESVVRKVDQGEGTLGRLVNDPTLYTDLQVAVGDLKNILGRLEDGEGTIGKLLQDPALYEEARQTMANLREISGRMREGQGTLGRLYADDTLYNQANEAIGQIRDIAADVNAGKGTLGKLVKDDALYEEFRGTMARVNSIAAKIDDGQGTIGRLINEDDLYREAKTTLHKVEKTVDGLSDSGPLSALGVVLGTLF